MRRADQWPPAGVRYDNLLPGNAVAVAAASRRSTTAACRPSRRTPKPPTSFDYPNPGWVTGVVVIGPDGPASGFDSVAPRPDLHHRAPRPRTSKSPDRSSSMLYASSTATDTRLLRQAVGSVSAIARRPRQDAQSVRRYSSRKRLAARLAPRARSGAQHRHGAIPHPHQSAAARAADKIYRFDISSSRWRTCSRQGHRIRLEIVNGDSPATEMLWPHYYRPDRIGTDTIHHDGAQPSQLILPVMPANK